MSGLRVGIGVDEEDTADFPDKINFAPHKADQIEGLHERVANRLKWVIDTNQGLYLKLGQALGG